MRGKPPGTILCWEAFSVEVPWQGTVGKKERLLAACGTWKRLGKVLRRVGAGRAAKRAAPDSDEAKTYPFYCKP